MSDLQNWQHPRDCACPACERLAQVYEARAVFALDDISDVTPELIEAILGDEPVLGISRVSTEPHDDAAFLRALGIQPW
jgi:hypothetical protein